MYKLKKCVGCGEEFVFNSPNKRFCTKECREKNSNNRYIYVPPESKAYTCIVCGQKGVSKIAGRRQKYCSKECSAIFQGRKAKNKNIPSGTRGAISELKVSADLLEREYAVFRSLSPACSCDLAILKNNHLIKVEVTTGYVGIDGKMSYPSKKDKNKYDLLAVVIGNDIHYFPELP